MVIPNTIDKIYDCNLLDKHFQCYTYDRREDIMPKPKPLEPMVTVSVYVSKTLLGRLDKLATASGSNRSKIIELVGWQVVAQIEKEQEIKK